ncbi:MAG: acyltransferase [Acidimicrobiales bacterium]
MGTPVQPQTRPRFVSNAPSLGFVPPFDGFRGMAVVLVVIVHAASEQLAGFAPLVDVFFIISGFLITTLLLQEDRKDGSINLREFFRRRAIRLFPVMYTVLLATLVGGLAFGDAKFRHEVLSDVGAAAIYMYHVIHPVNQTLVSGGLPPSRPLIQLWSLSVEEHFYLFGALVTVLAVRFNKVKPLIAAFVGFWVFVCIARATDHVGWDMMWYQRPDAIAIGVAGAFLNGLMPKELAESTVKRIRIAGGFGFFLLMFAMLSGTVLLKPFGLYVRSFPRVGSDISKEFLWGQYGYSLANFGAALMVVSLVRGGDWWLVRGMSGKLWRALGRRSYIIYLIHFPLAMILDQIGAQHEKFQTLGGLLYVPLLIGSTEFTHRFIEKPAVRYFRNRGRATPTPTVTG